jgi:hypothetical protein
MPEIHIERQPSGIGGSAFFPFLRRRDIRMVLGIWVVWSVVVVVLAMIAATLPVTSQRPWSPEIAREAPPLARWDSGWYRDIAVRGYHYDPEAPACNTSFYPLYPLVTGFVSHCTHIPVFPAGMAISLLCLLAALLLLADLLAEDGPDRVLPGIAVLLCFPTAFYFASFYPESLFILATAAAFFAAKRGRWSLAGIAGAAAGLTRLNGVLIILPMAWFAWQEMKGSGRRLKPGPVFGLAGAAAGAAAYPIFLWVRFGSPLVYFPGKNATWQHRPRAFWELPRLIAQEMHTRLADLGGGGKLNFVIQNGALVLFTILTIGLVVRRKVAGALYCAATLAVLFNSGSTDSVQRYLLALFPCLFLLSDFLRKRPVLAFAYFFGSLGLLVTLLTRFVHWIWVA